MIQDDPSIDSVLTYFENIVKQCSDSFKKVKSGKRGRIFNTNKSWHDKDCNEMKSLKNTALRNFR